MTYFLMYIGCNVAVDFLACVNGNKKIMNIGLGMTLALATGVLVANI